MVRVSLHILDAYRVGFIDVGLFLFCFALLFLLECAVCCAPACS